MLRRMSEHPADASFLDRVNTLSAPAVVGLGAAAGLLFAILSALQVDSSPDRGLAPIEADAGGAKDPATPAGAQTRAEKAADDSAQDEIEAAAAQAAGQPEADAGDDPSDAPTPGPDVGAVIDAEADPAAEAELELEPDTETGDDADGENAGDEAGDDDDAAVGSSPPPSPAGRSQADRDAEAKMTADELLTAATEAYQDKRYKDAYRLATRSQRSRPLDEAQMLRGRAACRLRDENNAREIVRSFKLGDEHRKTLRTFCKDHGVRVGL